MRSAYPRWKSSEPLPGTELNVADVVENSGLVRHPGTGIARPLMAGGVKKVAVAEEMVLGAVAMMDVEIDHRHPLQAMHMAGIFGSDGDIVEQAEPHRRRGFGVMSWRANGTERVSRIAFDDRVHRIANATDRAKCRLPRGGVHRRVRVEMDMAAGRNIVENPFDVKRRMHLLNFLDRALGCLASLQQREHLVVQNPGDRHQTLGALWMP